MKYKTYFYVVLYVFYVFIHDILCIYFVLDDYVTSVYVVLAQA